MSTPTLLSYQQILGSSNEMMDNFATGIESMVKDKKIGKEFLDSVIEKLGPNVNKNSDYIDEIDKELISRVQRDLPGSITSKVMTTWYKRLQEAQAAFVKDNPEPEKVEEVKKPNFKVHKKK